MDVIENIDSELGNSILKELINNGWIVIEQYSKDAIDKSIDYDFYTLKNNSDTLFFEWDNWSEWLIKGEDKFTEIIRAKYGLKNT